MRIFLIGYMYAGKTTVGRQLAARMGLRFLDLDQAIEERYHTSSTLLMERYGEEAFRKIEQAMLQQVAQMEDVVISTGGGTPCFFDNMEVILRHGVSVYLLMTLDEILSREACSRKRRPLLAGLTSEEKRDRIAAHLAQREPYYRRAAITIPAFNPDLDALVRLLGK